MLKVARNVATTGVRMMVTNIYTNHQPKEFLDFGIECNINNRKYAFHICGDLNKNDGKIERFYFNNDLIMQDGKEVDLEEGQVNFLEQLIMSYFREIIINKIFTRLLID